MESMKKAGVSSIGVPLTSLPGTPEPQDTSALGDPPESFSEGCAVSVGPATWTTNGQHQLGLLRTAAGEGVAIQMPRQEGEVQMQVSS